MVVKDRYSLWASGAIHVARDIDLCGLPTRVSRGCLLVPTCLRWGKGIEFFSYMCPIMCDQEAERMLWGKLDKIKILLHSEPYILFSERN